ncbi:MAG TPA: hypothetical protein PKA00_20430 [Saprospiraceae bacterium]|nr:hypothetical protein [Saprospiraceae bacterium]HMQ85289.1 hypothetical protein [Saprospiraceae bacterium]
MITILFLVGLYYIARFIFTILLYLSPLLLIAALVIDRKVVLDYIKWLVGLFKSSPATGMITALLSIVGFPLVSAYLLIKALLKKRIRQVAEEVRSTREGEFIEYEELDSEPLDLSRLEEQASRFNRHTGEDSVDR